MGRERSSSLAGSAMTFAGGLLWQREPASLSFLQPGAVIAIGGVKPKVTAAKLLKTGEKVAFTQDEFFLRLSSLPVTAPDSPSTVIELQCDGEPAVDHGANRPLWPRYKSGISA